MTTIEVEARIAELTIGVKAQSGDLKLWFAMKQELSQLLLKLAELK